MERKKATEFDPELLRLFDQYVHGGISRREFMDGAAKFAVGGVTAAALVEALSPNYAFAEQVPKDDKRLKTEYITFQSPQGYGSIRAYLARPADAKGKLPGVLVVHENRGLNPYIEDVARRLGVAGYLTLAPDELTPVGGYPGDDDKGRDLQAKLDQKKMMEDWYAAAMFLKSNPACTGKLGVVGFCYGGSVTNALAVRIPDLAAAVPFYGMQPTAEETAKIKAPLLIHYGGLDDRVNAGWPAYEAALKSNHVTYTAYIYQGANHGFHNDTTPRYDKTAATLAWDRTIEFFNKYLK
ncbi:MAG TPA: YghX family hydrolase [Candidatus Acidoferrales bacterium]|nr:YghX family hydrolase [Candidatus Acidoferrales bacterium]